MPEKTRSRAFRAGCRAGAVCSAFVGALIAALPAFVGALIAALPSFVRAAAACRHSHRQETPTPKQKASRPLGTRGYVCLRGTTLICRATRMRVALLCEHRRRIWHSAREAPMLRPANGGLPAGPTEELRSGRGSQGHSAYPCRRRLSPFPLAEALAEMRTCPGRSHCCCFVDYAAV